jgi:hypothetical protein
VRRKRQAWAVQCCGENPGSAVDARSPLPHNWLSAISRHSGCEHCFENWASGETRLLLVSAEHLTYCRS